MMRRPAILGGNWNDDDWAGSRYANVTNWPDNSNHWISARGRSDDRDTPFGRLPLALDAHALAFGQPLRVPGANRSTAEARSTPATAASALHTRGVTAALGGRPGSPASANTLHGPAERGVAARSCRRDPGPASHPHNHGRHMGKRYRNLIGAIADDRNLLEAYRLTRRGKRLTPGCLDFKEFDVLNLAALGRELREGTYAEGEAHRFWILDPKRRLISALPFRDRVAQQAIGLIVGPLLDRAMLPRAFACRVGKGTHAAAVQLQAELRRLQRVAPVWVLKTDFSRYFASIDRAVLWRLIESKISCRATLRVLEAIVPREGLGLPIGNLLSQVLANLYTGFSLELPGQPERERIIARYLAPFGLPRRALKALAEGFETASPALMRQFCEHLKRMIVIGPKLKHDMRKDAVFERLVTSIQPHPTLGKPPMWATADADLARDRAVKLVPWPLPLVADVEDDTAATETSPTPGKVVPIGRRG